jgi:ribosomal protein L7/L12
MTNKLEKELRRQIRDLKLALRFQAETVRIIVERIPPTKTVEEAYSNDPAGLFIPAVERIALQEGKLAAIKFVRAKKGIGLREAKVFVESIKGITFKER